jgi:hypothetical protein
VIQIHARLVPIQPVEQMTLVHVLIVRVDSLRFRGQKYVHFALLEHHPQLEAYAKIALLEHHPQLEAYAKIALLEHHPQLEAYAKIALLEHHPQLEAYAQLAVITYVQPQD